LINYYISIKKYSSSTWF